MCQHDHTAEAPAPVALIAVPDVVIDSPVDLTGAPQIVFDTLTSFGATDAETGVRFAHKNSPRSAVWVGAATMTRERAEAALEATLAPGATRSVGAGNRTRAEEPDPIRPAFLRDLDRVTHSTAFRRLAGKTQVVLNSGSVRDGVRTRLTHALEVEQVALAIGVPLGLNPHLLAAAARAHDTGHTPFGHAGEEALSPYLPEGYDHALYGADVTLAPLNLTAEVIDAVRCHSWRLASPTTPEGTVVSWADRIAYVCHDFDDAVRAGIIDGAGLPAEVAQYAGTKQSEQIRAFVGAMLSTTSRTGLIGMEWQRPASHKEFEKGKRILADLVEYFADAPGRVPGATSPLPVSGSPEALADAVHYVSGMTDRYALRLAVERLGHDASTLPRSV
jgi:dGTPase